jgi:hypothetical protein
MTVNHNCTVVPGTDLCVKCAVNGIVLQHVGHRLGIGIGYRNSPGLMIDSHNLYVRSF